MMNDFTKEELIDILDAFQYIKDSPSWRMSEGFNYELTDKIQSMVDNYCDHHDSSPDYNYEPMKCHKCEKIWI